MLGVRYTPSSVPVNRDFKLCVLLLVISNSPHVSSADLDFVINLLSVQRLKFGVLSYRFRVAVVYGLSSSAELADLLYTIIYNR